MHPGRSTRTIARVRRLVALLALAPGVVQAQPASPASSVAEIHDHAVALATEGWEPRDPVKLAAAVAEFKRAIALDDAPKYECNLAQALERLGELARAHSRLARCTPRLTAISPDPTVVRPMIDRMIALEGELARTHVPVRLEVTAGDATATLAGVPDDEIMVLPTTVWLAPGSHQVTVRFPGRRDPATVAIAVDASQLGAPRRTERIETPAERPLAPAVVEPERPAAPVVERRRSRRGPAIAMAAGGAVVLGGAVVHYLSRDKRAHLASLSGEAYDDYLPTWRLYQRATIGLYGAGTIALGVGAYLFFRDRGSPLAIAPAPAGDGAVVSWTLRAPE